mmetsp:Transcript_37520/g.94323  ORF Transcript_37520/g.94323 Transcript_37520/m.94323 type:complete len:203 (+) Transcript_37520:1226-1834(+)
MISSSRRRSLPSMTSHVPFSTDSTFSNRSGILASKSNLNTRELTRACSWGTPLTSRSMNSSASPNDTPSFLASISAAKLASISISLADGMRASRMDADWREKMDWSSDRMAVTMASCVRPLKRDFSMMPMFSAFFGSRMVYFLGSGGGAGARWSPAYVLCRPESAAASCSSMSVSQAGAGRFSAGTSFHSVLVTWWLGIFDQ